MLRLVRFRKSVLVGVLLCSIFASSTFAMNEWQRSGYESAFYGFDDNFSKFVFNQELTNSYFEEGVQNRKIHLNRILEFLKSSDARLRERSVQIIKILGKDAVPLIPSLIELMEDKRLNTYALKALRPLVSAPEFDIQQILELFKHDDFNTRKYSADLFGYMDKFSAHDTQVLLSLIEDQSNAYKICGGVDLAVAKVKTHFLIHIPMLLGLLDSKNYIVRRNSVCILGLFEEVARYHYYKILELIHDQNFEVRLAAVNTLGMLTNYNNDLINDLQGLLESQDKETRAIGAMTLINLSRLQPNPIDKLRSNFLTYEKISKRFLSLGPLSEDIASNLVQLIEDHDYRVRNTAMISLQALGKGASPQIQHIVRLLEHPNIQVRSLVANELVHFGDLIEVHIPYLIDIFTNNPDSDVRHAAYRSLQLLGDYAVVHASKLTSLLDHDNPQVRQNTINILEKLRFDFGPYTKKLIRALNDESLGHTAAKILVKNKEETASHADDLINLLKSSKKHSRQNAALVLKRLYPPSSTYNSTLNDLLIDKDEQVRISAFSIFRSTTFDQRYKKNLKTFLNIGDDDSRMSAISLFYREGFFSTDDLIQMLNDGNYYVSSFIFSELNSAHLDLAPFSNKLLDLLESPHYQASNYAKQLLVKLPLEDHARRLSELLESPSPFARRNAAFLLSKMKNINHEHIQRITELLDDPDKETSIVALRALSQLGYCDNASLPTIKDKIYSLYFNGEIDLLKTLHDASGECLQSKFRYIPLIFIDAIESDRNIDIYEYSYYAFLAAGNDTAVSNTIKLLDRRNQKISAILSSKQDAIELLQFSINTINESDPILFRHVRKNLASRTLDIISNYDWNASDITLLETLEASLSSADYEGESLVVKNALEKLHTRKYFKASIYIGLFHLAFWILLLCFYTRSRTVQSVFFWNPYARRIIGLGYIGLLLTYVPFFRKILLKPFEENLLSDANSHKSRSQYYFSETEVLKGDNTASQLSYEIGNFHGQVLIEGESGLGKTAFLLHYAQESNRQVAYLRADRCTDGVIPALQKKVHGYVKNETFLRNIIHQGAIDICIDGISEVSSDIRYKIRDFAETNYKANLIMTSQPIDWNHPTTCRTWVIQPLQEKSILKFLLAMYSSISSDSKLNFEEYNEACKNYLQNTLKKTSDDRENKSILKILSNPMDLSVIANMLSHKVSPHIFDLREQQFDIMRTDFERTQLQEFPLDKFSSFTYQMRVNNRFCFKYDELQNEDLSRVIPSLEKHKLILRSYIDDQNDSIEYRFRHDKIMDFFIAQTFLKKNSEYREKHLTDSRFRGVYFLLSDLLTMEDANLLRDDLINSAADTKDHSISDEFIKLLRSRREKEQR